MKQVVSISIGSSKRDHSVEIELLGERVHIWREGTDGDMADAVRRLREYDGTVDAFVCARAALDAHADRRRFDVEDGA